MKSSHLQRSKKTSRRDPKPPPGTSRAMRKRRTTSRGAAATMLAERWGAVIAREKLVRRREQALAVQKAALDTRGASARTRGEIERLMSQMREANARLIVAAVRAQNLSEEAHAEAAQAKAELEDLMRELQDANERLAAAAAHAHTMAAEAKQHEEAHRRLSGRLLQLQDDERRRLAVDLHDSMGQRLAALTMNLDLVEKAKKALDARSRRALVESRSLAEQCSREVRTLAYLLHPPLLDETGLVSAVRWYAEGFTKRSGIRVVMHLGEVGRLPGPIETALFRVVQESLTNVHRHASASTASIRLTSTTHGVVLDIHDQGRGLHDPFTWEQGTLPPATLGVGIQGMRERVHQLGGTFKVEFADTGTNVHVHVPLPMDN